MKTVSKMEEKKISLGSTIKRSTRKAAKFICEKRHIILALALVLVLCSPTVRAFADTGSAEQKWKDAVDFFAVWIKRLGGAILLVGAILFGLGWKDDNPDGKLRGMQVMIAGAIVIAVGYSTSTFLY